MTKKRAYYYRKNNNTYRERQSRSPRGTTNLEDFRYDHYEGRGRSVESRRFYNPLNQRRSVSPLRLPRVKANENVNITPLATNALATNASATNASNALRGRSKAEYLAENLPGYYIEVKPVDKSLTKSQIVFWYRKIFKSDFYVHHIRNPKNMENKVILRLQSAEDVETCVEEKIALHIGLDKTKYTKINVFDLIHQVENLHCRTYEEFRALNENRLRREIALETVLLSQKENCNCPQAKQAKVSVNIKVEESDKASEADAHQEHFGENVNGSESESQEFNDFDSESEDGFMEAIAQINRNKAEEQEEEGEIEE